MDGAAVAPSSPYSNQSNAPGLASRRTRSKKTPSSGSFQNKAPGLKAMDLPTIFHFKTNSISQRFISQRLELLRGGMDKLELLLLLVRLELLLGLRNPAAAGG